MEWLEVDLKKLDSAQTYADLYAIASEILLRKRSDVCIVSGPISTGGLGSVEKNLERFALAIKKLSLEDKCVFDQLPFEVPMQRIKKLKSPDAYDMAILEDFYLPLFKSGLITKIYFLPDWETSVGARWEHNQAMMIGIDVEYLAND